MSQWHLPHTFEFEGRYVKYGVKGEGKALVMVHGTPWSSFNLRHLIQELSGTYTVYFFDLLGYGESEKSDGDVSLGVQNKLLDALINHRGIESPLVVGHDFGGTTVLRNHILDKRDFSKIVLIDPVALSPWGSPFFKHIEKHEAAFSGVPDYIHAAIVEAYIKTAAFQKLDQTAIDGILAPWSGELGQPAFYRQIAQADSKYTDEFQNQFCDVSAPVLILWGEEDQWIPCEQGKTLQSKIEGSQFITVPNTGHLIIEENPTQLAIEIKAFFEA